MSLTPSGFLLIDKPAGWTSFDVVAKLRRTTGVRKIGHAGTLDPFATGLLIVAVGRDATKHLDRFLKQDKVYETVLQLGTTSTTHDPEGELTQQSTTFPDADTITHLLQTQFTGEQQQLPPMHAAIKIGGKKLYEFARAGQTVERTPRTITLHSCELVSYVPPLLTLRLHVSSGTYIRAIARDLGEHLHTGAYCLELRRTQIGMVHIQDARRMDDLSSDTWTSALLPVEALLPASTQ